MPTRNTSRVPRGLALSLNAVHTQCQGDRPLGRAVAIGHTQATYYPFSPGFPATVSAVGYRGRSKSYGVRSTPEDKLWRLVAHRPRTILFLRFPRHCVSIAVGYRGRRKSYGGRPLRTNCGDWSHIGHVLSTFSGFPATVSAVGYRGRSKSYGVRSTPEDKLL